MPVNVGVLPGGLRVLEETLWEWTFALERSCRLWGWRDAPWWYGERASLSVLAGAIWKSGGVALEEYAIERKKDVRHNQRTRRTGRNDLYFNLGGNDFVLEAKILWSNMKSGTPLVDLRAKLDSAKCDVRSVKDTYGARRLAAVFVSPSIAERHVHRMDESIVRLIDALRDETRCARSWSFFDVERTRWLVSGKPTPARFPGAALIIQEL